MAGALPPYNVYGADGDVSGELVYVNYGMPDDYKELERRAITVKGKIVLARYRGGWRGLKPKLAYEHGAIGCLIYSDPRDDGYYQGDPYPAGGWRPATACSAARWPISDLSRRPAHSRCRRHSRCAARGAVRGQDADEDSGAAAVIR